MPGPRLTRPRGLVSLDLRVTPRRAATFPWTSLAAGRCELLFQEISGWRFFLEVGVLSPSASPCYFYTVVRGGFIGKLVKPSSGLCLQCERGAGSLCSPVETFAETVCLLSRRKEDKWSNALTNLGWTEKDLLCFFFWLTELRRLGILLFNFMLLFRCFDVLTGTCWAGSWQTMADITCVIA